MARLRSYFPVQVQLIYRLSTDRYRRSGRSKAVGVLEFVRILVLLKIIHIDGLNHDEERLTSHKSMATSQLWRTTSGASSRAIHSFRCGNTSGVPIPPRASAASCRTISDSLEFSNTFKRAGTEWAERSCPKTNAISCL